MPAATRIGDADAPLQQHDTGGWQSLTPSM